MAGIVVALPAQVHPGLHFAELGKRHLPVDLDQTRALAFGDVDGDGDLDLVVGNWGQQNRLYRNSGTGTFTDGTAGRMPVDDDRTTSLVLGDVDGDGDLDLVIGNFQQQNRLYRNDGTGTFTAATTSRLPLDNDGTTSVAMGDVDLDGDLDLVIGNGHGQQNRLYTNLQRQLDAPHLLRAGQPYTLDVYSRAGLSSASDLAFPYLSTTRRSIPVPPYGTLGIDPMAPLPLVLIPQPVGVGTVTWTVPNNPAFAGVEVFAQALILQSTSVRLTNGTADVIMR